MSVLEKTGKAVDSLIAAFSPLRALRRERARATLDMLGAYRGAEKNRLRDTWVPSSASADSILIPDLPTLRDRSRDLNRNDGTAAAITNTVVVNTVGTGLRPQSRIDRDGLRVSDTEADEFERQAERAWKRWFPQADSQNRMDFYEMQALLERQILENGEVLVLPLRIREAGRFLPIGFEVIEADRLDTPPEHRGNPRIRSGVELGDRGQPVAYWINTGHPNDGFLTRTFTKNEFIRYPAFDPRTGLKTLYHLYWVKRPRQTRGEPFFAPVMTAFKDLADYLEAELVAARIQACFALIFESQDPMGLAGANTTRTDTSGTRLEEVEPGLVHYAAQGEKVNMVNPQRPGGTFEPFVDRVVRFIGSALGLPYELVVKDFSKTNYSSARAALLEARRFFRCRQTWIASRFCQPVWESVMREAWLQGHLPGVNLFAEDADLWLKATWIAPGWGWVDPLKEVQASKEAMAAGLSTLADECASIQGGDWEEKARQKKREQTFYEKENIKGGPNADSQETPGAGGSADPAKDIDIEDLPEVPFSHAEGNGNLVGV